jgi:hypothetical protein
MMKTSSDYYWNDICYKSYAVFDAHRALRTEKTRTSWNNRCWCSVLEQDQPEQQKRQPDLNATSLFDAHSLILINNVKNLVILIPNQGHHGPGEQDEARFIEQSFVPENTVISRGTNVIWFNDVVGHEHDLVVTDNATGQNVFQTG